MRSRMDRYHQLDDSSLENSRRSSRNQELYRNVGTNTKYTNFTDVSNSNIIEINRNKQDYHTREGYQQGKEYRIMGYRPKAKKELDDFNHLYQNSENRVYDINSILETAKQNRKEKDGLERKRKLKNTNYNILASLNPEELEKYRREKQQKRKPEDQELRGLIDTITSKTLAGEISKETGVDLLSDLMATNAVDSVASDIKEEEDISKDILDQDSLKEVEEAKKSLPIKEENEMMKDLDQSFYTKSMDLSDKDFFMDDDGSSERKVPIIVKILLILILLALVAVGACFLYQSL